MSSTRQQTAVPAQRRMQPEATGWVGWIFFAGAMMIMLGVLHLIEGLVALTSSTYFLVTEAKLVGMTNYTSWGWGHVVAGLVVAVAGAALLSGRTWARVTAVVVTILSAAMNLLFMSAYPWWSLVALTIDVLVIYAVTVHGSELKVD